jgi:hypothetical protein
LAQSLNARKGSLGFEFAPQPPVMDDFIYESFIAQHKRIPTRENAHDFFNGLSWISFARTKTAMVGLQASEIAKAQAYDDARPSARGPVRDALTVFDENGILLCADDLLWSALLRKDWHSLFVKHRALWRDAKVWLFGHALLEKLLKPRPAITGHVLNVKVPSGLSMESLDAWLSPQIAALNWSQKPFAPLPVLGIPGWCEDNEDPNFYLNRSVFRF